MNYEPRVRTPISKMFRWKTRFPLTTRLRDIGNVLNHSGTFSHPYALKIFIDFQITVIRRFHYVIKRDVITIHEALATALYNLP